MYALTVKENTCEKARSVFSVLDKCGNIEETKVVFEQICIMQPNEIALAILDRSVGLFSNKGKGKSGVLFTNLNLRIFSKQLLAKENETFALTEIKNIAALGGNDYLITTTSGGSYKFEIHMGEMTIEEQNFLADLIYRCTQLIKHIYIDQRIQLGNILNFDGAEKENNGLREDYKCCGDKLNSKTSSTIGNSADSDIKIELDTKKANEERKNSSKQLAIISLILGIVSYFMILTIIPPIVTSVTGLIFGFKGLKSEFKKTAVGGIIVNLSFIVFFVAILMFA